MLVISIGKIQVGCHIYINPPYKKMKSVLLDKGNSRQSDRPFVFELFSDLGRDHSRVNLDLMKV